MIVYGTAILIVILAVKAAVKMEKAHVLVVKTAIVAITVITVAVIVGVVIGKDGISGLVSTGVSKDKTITVNGTFNMTNRSESTVKNETCNSGGKSND